MISSGHSFAFEVSEEGRHSRSLVGVSAFLHLTAPGYEAKSKPLVGYHKTTLEGVRKVPEHLFYGQQTFSFVHEFSVLCASWNSFLIQYALPFFVFVKVEQLTDT